MFDFTFVDTPKSNILSKEKRYTAKQNPTKSRGHFERWRYIWIIGG